MPRLGVPRDPLQGRSDLVVDQLQRAGTSGGTNLAGGATDTLVFDVTTVGNTPGTIAINGEVRSTELNSGRVDLDGTGDGGSGTILVVEVP